MQIISIKSNLHFPATGSMMRRNRQRAHSMSMETYIARLKQSGHRITPKVRAVLELFLERRSILDPFEVQARLQKQFKAVGLPTIYRILESLASCGILMTAANEDRQLRYYICG